MFQKILFNGDNWWSKGSELVTNPVEDSFGDVHLRYKIIGIKFIKPIRSNVGQFPKNIEEAWLSIENNGNKLYLKNQENKWYSFQIVDDYLKNDFDILKSILLSNEKYELSLIR